MVDPGKFHGQVSTEDRFDEILADIFSADITPDPPIDFKSDLIARIALLETNRPSARSYLTRWLPLAICLSAAGAFCISNCIFGKYEKFYAKIDLSRLIQDWIPSFDRIAFPGFVEDLLRLFPEISGSWLAVLIGLPFIIMYMLATHVER
jgi:hypothetical protein